MYSLSGTVTPEFISCLKAIHTCPLFFSHQSSIDAIFSDVSKLGEVASSLKENPRSVPRTSEHWFWEGNSRYSWQSGNGNGKCIEPDNCIKGWKGWVSDESLGVWQPGRWLCHYSDKLEPRRKELIWEDGWENLSFDYEFQVFMRQLNRNLQQS